jgi:hypothetical protein
MVTVARSKGTHKTHCLLSASLDLVAQEKKRRQVEDT